LAIKNFQRRWPRCNHLTSSRTACASLGWSSAPWCCSSCSKAWSLLLTAWARLPLALVS